jgi:hypothetical protein
MGGYESPHSIDREAALPYHFLEVTIAEGITQIPAYAEKDYFVLVMTPFELIRFSHSRLPVCDECGKSISLDYKSPFFCNRTAPILSSHGCPNGLETMSENLMSKFGYSLSSYLRAHMWTAAI